MIVPFARSPAPCRTFSTGYSSGLLLSPDNLRLNPGFLRYSARPALQIPCICRRATGMAAPAVRPQVEPREGLLRCARNDRPPVMARSAATRQSPAPPPRQGGRMPRSARNHRPRVIARSAATRQSPAASLAPAMTRPAGPEPSDEHALHAAGGIAGAGGGAHRDRLADLRRLVGAQRYVERAEIFLQPLDALGAGDRDHVVALRQQPGEAELGDGAALVGGDRLDALDQGAVPGEVLALETGMPPARIAGREVGEIRNHAGQQAAPERGVGDKGDAELPRHRPRRLADLAVKQRILALHRGERMRRMGAADALGRRLAQADMAHLALLDEPRHAADRFLDRNRGIDAVLVVQVDVIDAEPLQARLAGPLEIFGAAVHPVGAARVLGLAELGGEHDLVAPAFQRPADHRLVLAPAVHVGAVEMVDPEIDRLLQKADRRFVVALAVDPRQRHA